MLMPGSSSRGAKQRMLKPDSVKQASVKQGAVKQGTLKQGASKQALLRRVSVLVCVACSPLVWSAGVAGNPYADEGTYTEIVPDRISGVTTHGKSVYRDMKSDALDTEAMVEVLPGDDPALQLPEPTVIPVDGYSERGGVVIAPDRISGPETGPENRIFELINGGPREARRMGERVFFEK